MKKVIFTLLSFTLLYINSNAQYCGVSGSSVCTPSNLSAPGLSPPSDSLPAVVNGTQVAQVIQFKNFNTFVFGGAPITIQSLKVDTISNLPAGLCWATNKANNTFGNQENGCIKVTGLVCSDPGQYKLHIWVDAFIGLPSPISTDADVAGLKYFVRCINDGAQTPNVDTTQTAVNPFISYNYAKVCTTTAIGGVEGDFNALNIVPNPFSNTALVTFNSDKAGMVTEKLTNMIGSVIFQNTVEIHLGSNTSTISRNSLPVGVYFYTVGDGNSALTKRVIISE